MRLIDADKIPYKKIILDDDDEFYYGVTQPYIDRMPTVDAVPVVRCMDCKYSEHWYGDRNRCFLWVEDGIGVFEDGFCSYGERKGGDEG